MKSLSIDLNLLITEALYWFQLAKKTFKFDAITGNVLYVFLRFSVLEAHSNQSFLFREEHKFDKTRYDLDFQPTLNIPLRAGMVGHGRPQPSQRHTDFLLRWEKCSLQTIGQILQCSYTHLFDRDPPGKTHTHTTHAQMVKCSLFPMPVFSHYHVVSPFTGHLYKKTYTDSVNILNS